MVNGALLINKKVGVTSRQEVNNISRILKEKKAGHIGTLDPFADGLLIVLLGKSTKIAPFLEVMDKTYIATLKLGEKTDSGDLTGNVIETKKVPVLNRKNIDDLLQKMVGKHEQIPPMYSAIKVNGKQLYKYARNGEEIERKSRTINIFDISCLSFEKDSIVFVCKVSKGTYIRTLGEEIAEKLGSVGHLTKLTRVAIGNYSIENAVVSDNVTEKDLLSNEEMLKDFPSVIVSGDLLKQVNNGMHVKLDTNKDEVLVRDDKEIIAIYKKQSNGYYFCARGLK